SLRTELEDGHGNRLRGGVPAGRESRWGHARVAVERACEKRRVSGCGAERVHRVGTPPDRGYRVAIGHRLAHRGQVGQYAGNGLVAAEAMTETGDDLVEYEDGPILRAQPPQPLQESLDG